MKQLTNIGLGFANMPFPYALWLLYADKVCCYDILCLFGICVLWWQQRNLGSNIWCFSHSFPTLHKDSLGKGYVECSGCYCGTGTDCTLAKTKERNERIT